MNWTKRFGLGSPLKKLFCGNGAKRNFFLFGFFLQPNFSKQSSKGEFSTHPKISTECGKLTVWSSGAPESLRKQPYQTILCKKIWDMSSGAQ